MRLLLSRRRGCVEAWCEAPGPGADSRRFGRAAVAYAPRVVEPVIPPFRGHWTATSLQSHRQDRRHWIMRRIVTVVLGMALMALPAAAFAVAAGTAAAVPRRRFPRRRFPRRWVPRRRVPRRRVSTAVVSTPRRRPASTAGSAARRRRVARRLRRLSGAPSIGGIHGRWVGNRFWHPGYWGWRGGARTLDRPRLGRRLLSRLRLGSAGLGLERLSVGLAGRLLRLLSKGPSKGPLNTDLAAHATTDRVLPAAHAATSRAP